MISKKTAILFTLVIGLCTFALVRTAASTQPTVAINQCFQTCNNYGAAENTFSPSEDVYVNGSGFQTCATLNIFVVCHQATWSNGQAIPSRIKGTATTMTVDASGNILPTIVWTHNLIPGSYDIVVDTNCNGIYDQNVDYVVSNSVNVNAGFFVVPEYLLGAILGLAAFFGAYGVFRLSKTRDTKNLTKKN